MRSRAGYARVLIFGMGLQGTHMGNICRVWPNLNPSMAKWDTLLVNDYQNSWNRDSTADRG